MQWETPEHVIPLDPCEYRRLIPIAPVAVSEGFGWAGRWRWSGLKDSLHVSLEPRLVERFAAESLANILAVHLVRLVSGSRSLARGRDAALPRGKLRAVVDYIEGRLDVGPTLAEMAAVTHLSPNHFAQQFKAAAGLPPHQYLIARRVERAKGLLQGADDLPLAQIAARSGFSDQSQFSRHFKRLVGITPGQFRRPARFA